MFPKTSAFAQRQSKEPSGPPPPFTPGLEHVGLSPTEQLARKIATLIDEHRPKIEATTATGPTKRELEDWYYALNGISIHREMNADDWAQLEDLRDAIYRFLR